jgi:tetratricopeptide (TPR) repeat protein
MADASIAYERALRLDPNRLEAALGLAKVARRRGDDTSAELLLGQVVARTPASTAALDALVTLERDRKNWPAALDWQTRRMSAETEAGAEAFNRLAEILLLSGDSARAQRAFETALEHDPYSFSAHNNLGRLYHDRKLWPQARAHLEFVARYFPDYDANAFLLLAEVYRQAGDARAAARVLRKGRRVFPEDAKLKQLAPAE